jgi:hypothetical protein
MAQQKGRGFGALADEPDADASSWQTKAPKGRRPKADKHSQGDKAGEAGAGAALEREVSSQNPDPTHAT